MRKVALIVDVALMLRAAVRLGMHITCEKLVQGEDRDSSDEEWAAAYAAMDPIRQLGWRNRRGTGEGPADQLMRDVFQAADQVHSDAMSRMGASRHREGSNSAPNGMAAIVDSMSRPTNACSSPAMSVEVDQDGWQFFGLSLQYSHFVPATPCVHVCGSIEQPQPGSEA